MILPLSDILVYSRKYFTFSHLTPKDESHKFSEQKSYSPYYPTGNLTININKDIKISIKFHSAHFSTSHIYQYFKTKARLKIQKQKSQYQILCRNHLCLYIQNRTISISQRFTHESLELQFILYFFSSNNTVFIIIILHINFFISVGIWALLWM